MSFNHTHLVSKSNPFYVVRRKIVIFSFPSTWRRCTFAIDTETVVWCFSSDETLVRLCVRKPRRRRSDLKERRRRRRISSAIEIIPRKRLVVSSWPIKGVTKIVRFLVKKIGRDHRWFLYLVRARINQQSRFRLPLLYVWLPLASIMHIVDSHLSKVIGWSNRACAPVFPAFKPFDAVRS